MYKTPSVLELIHEMWERIDRDDPPDEGYADYYGKNLYYLSHDIWEALINVMEWNNPEYNRPNKITREMFIQICAETWDQFQARRSS